MRILLALGGNALFPEEQALAPNRHPDVEAAAAALAEVAAGHEVAITHGSGVHGGQLLELALRNALPERDVVSVLSQIVVAADSPLGEPHAIAAVRSLRVLVGSGALVICAGGGIPISLNGMGTLHRVEAVVDMDLTAALLARRLEADLLLMLTDVDAVHADWNGPDQHPIPSAEAAELRAMRFASASMGPKVEAACRFAEATGRRAAIGALTEAARIAQGEAGTQVLSATSRSGRWPARSA